MKGPRPIPSAIKRARGNPGRRPLPKHEPRPTVSVPACPAELNAAARREWMRAGAILERLRVITDLDRGVLSIYCSAFATRMLAEKHIRKEGHIVDTVSARGVPMRVPNLWIRIGRDAGKQMMDACRELGLSPSSRTRVVALPDDDGQNDPFSVYEGGKQ